MERLLVIGYGNPLRSDDGIAWQAAEQLREKLPKTSKVICVHQLTPELAEDVAHADIVIFLDASSKGEPGSIRCDPVFEQPGEFAFSHHLKPAEVLALSNQLYSAKPRAFLISVHGHCFDHGQELSSAAIHAIPAMVAQVCTLMKRLGRESGITDQASTISESHAL